MIEVVGAEEILADDNLEEALEILSKMPSSTMAITAKQIVEASYDFYGSIMINWIMKKCKTLDSVEAACVEGACFRILN